MAGSDMGGAANLLALMRRAVELCMPDFRHYYRATRKAKVVAAYASDGKYYADVQPLRNDDTPDSKEPVVPKVEIPILWGGPKRGVVCPPAVGTHCDLSYYDGDPNYPRISNFRWLNNQAPECALTELVIQQEPGVSIKIDKAHKIITVTPASVETGAGQNWIINAGQNSTIVAGQNASITAGQDATVEAQVNATVTAQNVTASATVNAVVEAGVAVVLQAPQINLVGGLSAGGAGGSISESKERSNKTHDGSYTLNGPQTINGDVVVNGTVTAAEFIGPVRGSGASGG